MCACSPVKSPVVRRFGKLVYCWLWKYILSLSLPLSAPPPPREEFIELWQKAACKFLKLCRKAARYTLLSSVWLPLLTRIQADSSFLQESKFQGSSLQAERESTLAHAFSFTLEPLKLAAPAQYAYCYALSMTCTIRERLIDIHYVLLTETGRFSNILQKCFVLENS